MASSAHQRHHQRPFLQVGRTFSFSTRSNSMTVTGGSQQGDAAGGGAAASVTSSAAATPRGGSPDASTISAVYNPYDAAHQRELVALQAERAALLEANADLQAQLDAALAAVREESSRASVAEDSKCAASSVSKAAAGGGPWANASTAGQPGVEWVCCTGGQASAGGLRLASPQHPLTTPRWLAV